MNRNRQDNDPIREREREHKHTHTPGERDPSGERMRNKEERDLNRRDVERELEGEERADRESDVDRDF